MHKVNGVRRPNGNSVLAHGNALQAATAKELLTLKARRAAREEDTRERSQKEPDLKHLILSRSELDDLPEAPPMIPGVLNQGSLSMLVGRDSTYKTFIALDWALCLATGTAWGGKDVEMPDDRPSVLYVAAEGAYTLKTRIEAWEEHRGVDVAKGQGHAFKAGPHKGKYMETFHVLPKAVNLYDGPQIDDFVNLVSQHSDVGLVVIDTLRRVSGGADQNGSDMGVIIDNMTRIKEATKGGSVLVIAHTDKNDNDTRGSSLLEDDSDIVWHSKLDGKGVIRLVNRKMKDGPEHPEMHFSTETVGKSLVMVQPDPFEASVAELPDNDAELLAALRDLFTDEGATAAEFRRAVNIRREDQGRKHMAESSFMNSRKRLMETFRIIKRGARYRFPETAE